MREDNDSGESAQGSDRRPDALYPRTAAKMWLVLLAALLPTVRSAYELDSQKLQGLAKAKVEVTL